jgi:hypothetical protein
MMGRAVLVLLLLTGTALACPYAFDAGEPAPRTAAALTVGGAADDSQGAAIALMGLCGFAFALTRANAVRRTFATSHHMVDAELDLVKRVARAQRGRTELFVIACALAVAAIMSLPLALGARAVLAMTPAMLMATGFVALCRLQLLVGLRPEPQLRTMSHGHYLFAARGKRLVGWVAAPPALVARASHLPVATLRQ